MGKGEERRGSPAVPAAPPPPPPPPRPSKLASVVSGSLSGALISACIQPLDVLRTRMQADAARGAFPGALAAARAVVADGGGAAALWRGTQPTVVRLAVGAGLHFFFLESLRPLLESAPPPGGGGGGAAAPGGRPRLTPLAAAATGGLSRAAAALVSCPITVVKTRMEYVGPGAERYASTGAALAAIARAEGVRGLYRGLGPTVAANAPFSALYYAFYTQARDAYAARAGRPPGPAANFAAGAAAAVAATLLTQPFDVVRTRVQLGRPGGAGAFADRGPAPLALLRGIAAGQGARGLLAGAAPRVAKRTLQTALVWTLYEELMPRLSAARARWGPGGG